MNQIVDLVNGNMKVSISGSNTTLPIEFTSAYDSTTDALRTDKPYFLKQIMNVVSVPASNTVNETVDVSGYTNCLLMIEAGGTFSITAQVSPDGSFLTDSQTIASSVVAGNQSYQISKIGPFMMFAITNNSATASNFSAWVYAY